MQKWERKNRDSWQTNTHARTKVTRMKVGKSIKKFCRPKFVVIFDDEDQQVWTSQLLPVNANSEISADASIFLKLLKSDCARTPACDFSLQETRSWDVPNLKSLDYVCYGRQILTLHFGGSDSFPEQMKRSWRSEQLCAAVISGTIFVMTVYASPKHECVWNIHQECHRREGQDIHHRETSRLPFFRIVPVLVEWQRMSNLFLRVRRGAGKTF